MTNIKYTGFKHLDKELDALYDIQDMIKGIPENELEYKTKEVIEGIQKWIKMIFNTGEMYTRWIKQGFGIMVNGDFIYTDGYKK